MNEALDIVRELEEAMPNAPRGMGCITNRIGKRETLEAAAESLTQISRDWESRIYEHPTEPDTHVLMVWSRKHRTKAAREDLEMQREEPPSGGP